MGSYILTLHAKEKTRPRFEPLTLVLPVVTRDSMLQLTIILVYVNVAFESIAGTDLVPKSYFTRFN